MSPLRFGEPVDAPGLPINYMPRALRALRDPDGASALTLLTLGGKSEDTAIEVALPDRLARPADWEVPRGVRRADDAPLALDDAPDDARAMPLASVPERQFLGPRVVDSTARSRLTPRFTGIDVGFDLPPGAVLAVIDYGIAFWNRRFREGGLPLFRGMQFLDLSGEYDDLNLARLEAAAIAGLCADADKPNGQAAVRRDLATKFPDSFWGEHPDPDGLWHGTAMADLALGAATAKGGGAPILFGVELPAMVVEDQGGDAITAMLPLAVDAALGMTAGLAKRPLVILLAFGFTGGPHNGHHPIARVITKHLAEARKTREVTLVVPAGNHRQERCAARRAGASLWLDGGPAEVGWRLPADDFSPSAVEATLLAFSPAPRLVLTAPDGEVIPLVEIKEGQFTPLLHGGEVVGGLHVLPAAKGLLRLRLALAPTARAAGATALPLLTEALVSLPRPAPAGLWRLRIEGWNVRLWLLRDDASEADRGRPHRPSAFEDWVWRDRDGVGDWRLHDGQDAVVRRAGTLSVMATTPFATGVAAVELRPDRPDRDAAYSGLALLPWTAPKRRVVVERPAKGGAGLACANGGQRRLRVSGTSAAAAVAAGALARATVAAPP